MDKGEAREFYRWLDTASTPELGDKLAKVQRLLLQLREPSVRADARFCQRKIEEELLARWQVSHLPAGQERP